LACSADDVILAQLGSDEEQWVAMGVPGTNPDIYPPLKAHHPDVDDNAILMYRVWVLVKLVIGGMGGR